jgi:hypothetical protein
MGKRHPDSLGVPSSYDTLPEPFAEVRALSETVRDAGVPREVRLEVINSFREGTIDVRTATGSESFIRYSAAMPDLRADT